MAPAICLRFCTLCRLRSAGVWGWALPLAPFGGSRPGSPPPQPTRAPTKRTMPAAQSAWVGNMTTASGPAITAEDGRRRKITPSSMKHRKGPVRFRNRGRQPPHGNRAGHAAAVARRLSALVEDLPGQGTAALPAGALSPGAEHVAFGVNGQRGMLAALALARRGDRRVDLGCARLDPRPANLSVGVPRGDDAARAFRETL